MNNLAMKGLGIAAILLLSACGKGGISGLPRLSAGEALIFHYNCANGEGMDVEYAQMGGSYSATISIGGGKKVLSRDADGVFRLDDWRWRSSDEYVFTLSENDKVLRRDCVAMNQAETDDKRNVRSSLFGDEERREHSPQR